MLILQKDYIIVELNKNKGSWEGTGVNSVNDSDFYLRGGPIWSIDYTIQCNGKLKKHSTKFELKEENSDSNGASFNKYYIQDYNILYESIELLNDLGYGITNEEIIPQIESECRWTNN